MKRRSFMKILGLGTILFTAGKSLVVHAAAWKKKMLALDSKTAKRIKVAKTRKEYIGKKIDAKANCLNCKHYKIKKEKKEGKLAYAPCAMAGMKYVEQKWICQSWLKDKKRFKA